MNINYDILSIFLLIFIFYYLLFIISEKYKIIEGQDNSDTGSGDIMCYGNGEVNNRSPSLDFNRCSEWPFEFKSQASTTKQCLDGTTNCSEENKINNCCNQRAEMCQGNIKQNYNDWTCRGDSDIPKIDATELPRLCDENNTTDCWNSELRRGVPIGLEGCESDDGTCNLSNLPNDELRQNICCTNYALYKVAETVWGRPHLLSAANLKFNDFKSIKDVNPSDAEISLNEALDYLYQARQLSDNDRSIIETINDWSKEIQRPLGEEVCRGNINPIHDFPCEGLNKDFVSDSFIKKGSTSEECCINTGLCTGNTNSNEDVECPENTTVIEGKEGNNIEECCEADVKCTGNTNINQNYICPEPMIPKINSNEIYGTTKEECCRFADEKSYFEIDPVSENVTIYGTIIFNGDIFLSVGDKNSVKYINFINNFKKDIVKIINEDKKVIILENQVIVDRVYSGSVIVDFKIIPDQLTGISVSKDYFTYLLREEQYFSNIQLHSTGGLTNVKIVSWYNINLWPQWIWYFITTIITVLITIVIFV